MEGSNHLASRIIVVVDQMNWTLSVIFSPAIFLSYNIIILSNSSICLVQIYPESNLFTHSNVQFRSHCIVDNAFPFV